MGIIKPLDAKIANMIAAGEVVERPASIVKELVENSIDAQATSITVEIKGFGMSLIKVTDNGVGMDKADLKMAFYRHATSKIYEESDLHSINSLGFRGEAIPAIASVSKMTIASRQNGAIGHQITFEGGHYKSDGAASINEGTEVIVTNLFYNTPARFKYIKSERAEILAITETFERLAIVNPNIRFELIIDDKSIRKTLGQDDAYSIVSSIYGPNMANGLNSFKVEQQKIKIEFILLSHQFTRTNKRDISIFINNRYVQNYLLREAVIKGFAGKIMVGRYPIAIVKVNMDESLVDVNVHPQKLEVKMVNEYFLADLIERSVRSKINEATYGVIKDSKPVFKEQESNQEKYIHEQLDLTFFEEAINEIRSPESKKLPTMDYVGIVGGTYLLFQNEDGLYLMDQHAAAERIRYEYYYEKLSILDNKQKQLLIPYELEVTKTELELISKYKKELLKFGFSFDSNNHLISAPTWLRDDEFSDALIYLVTQLGLSREINMADYRDNLAKSISCKGSIKANKHLSRQEIDKLVSDLAKTKFPFTCPHGRPTITLLTHYEIEKMFKRVV